MFPKNCTCSFDLVNFLVRALLSSWFIVVVIIGSSDNKPPQQHHPRKRQRPALSSLWKSDFIEKKRELLLPRNFERVTSIGYRLECLRVNSTTKTLMVFPSIGTPRMIHFRNTSDHSKEFFFHSAYRYAICFVLAELKRQTGEVSLGKKSCVPISINFEGD